MNTITKQLFGNTPSILTAWFGAALVAGTSINAQTFTLQKIIPPAGTASCVAQGLNNSGQVVGRTQVKVGKNVVWGPAFIWANGQSTTLIPLSGEPSAEATRISSAGLIVGGRYLSTDGRATWWEGTVAGYQPRDWNDLPGRSPDVTLLRADSLSDDGRFISFQASIATVGLRDIVAQIELDSSGLLPQRLIAYWDITSVWGVTDVHHEGAGLVRAVGLGGPDVDFPGAFLWSKEPDGNLQLMDLHSSADQITGAWAVNSLGEVAGYRRNSAVYRAVYWSPNGIMQDIGTLGGTQAVANSINDAGNVVGWANTSGRKSVSHAFLWNSSKGMRDLNALKSSTDTSGLVLTSAQKINNTGQILAFGTQTTSSGPVLLIPVSTP